MSGIQISGLLSNSAFDWKSIVDQLVAASGIPIKKLTAEQEANTAKAEALGELGTLVADLKAAMQSIRADEIFSTRTVSSDLASTTWKCNSTSGAALGTYEFNVTQLATQAKLQGASDIGASFSTTSDVSGLTLATLPVPTAMTAGTFTVAGAQVTVELTDSLQDVFDAINTATGGSVTASYNPTTDRISLTKASGELILGAGNDTSNFLAVLKLGNSGGSTATSSGALGTAKTSATLENASLRRAITAVDGDGNGSFLVNGVSISYNVKTSTLNSVLSSITSSAAGVTASYDATNDRVTLTNNDTGDIGISVSETSGGLLDALGLTTALGGSLVHGKNAEFSLNGGGTLASTSNTLDSSVHGVTGLSVTVNTETTQTLQIEADTLAMQSAIEGFIEKFNAVQDFIEEKTAITVTDGEVSTAVLAGNREVQEWARNLRTLAFDEVSGLTGDISRLDHLGIDFDSTTSHLKIKDSGKLATALGDNPEDVEALFLTPETGLVSKFYSYITTVSAAELSKQTDLMGENDELDEQISTLQARLDAEREQLTNAFMRMLDAQSSAQSQSTYLTNTFFKNNNN